MYYLLKIDYFIVADPLFGDDIEDDMFSVAPITNLSTTRPSKPSKPSITSKPILPSKSRVKNWLDSPSNSLNILIHKPSTDTLIKYL